MLMRFSKEKALSYLNEAQEYANEQSGCKKVAVGSMVILHGANKITIYGANTALPESCKKIGCQRELLYGENSKNHRLPSDCRAVHSEIDAITQAAKFGMSTQRAVMFVTRYPCEACARAIVRAGIKRVYYGRNQEITAQTKDIFEKGGVDCVWVKEWSYEDTTH